MKPVNYNEISKVYDDVRTSDLVLIQRMIQEIPSNSGVRILDLGCGTGNYTDLLQKLTQAHIYGVEPSAGMLEKARHKNPHITFKTGQANTIPFKDNFFNFVYMTDVIHHVPDIKAMFIELWRVLNSDGKGCIVTQSHRQIEARPIVKYFPDTANADEERYPDIPEIINSASAQGFRNIKSEILEEEPLELDGSYLELVRKKGYSMLHLISEDEYKSGLAKLETDLDNGPVSVQPSGATLVWFTKV